MIYVVVLLFERIGQNGVYMLCVGVCSYVCCCCRFSRESLKEIAVITVLIFILNEMKRSCVVIVL